MSEADLAASSGAVSRAMPTRWSQCGGDMAVDSSQPTVSDQAIDEAARPVPPPGEPAAQLPLGRDDGGADPGGDQVGQGPVRIGAVAARGGMSLVPADQLAGVQVSPTGGDLQRAGDDRAVPFQ